MMFRILSALALACALACAAAAQEKGKQDGPKVSGGERDAAQKIEKASGAEAKLQLATAFVKKYPQSPLRAQVADAIAREITATTDQQAKGSLAQTFLEIFNLPEEAPLVTPSLLISYINTGQTQDAMRVGAEWLAKHPDDIETMQNLTIAASTAAIKGNNAFVQQGRDYGAKAIELLEADKMPAGWDAAKWPTFKQQSLVSLYRETGVLAHLSGNREAARPLLEKAASLRSNDPGVYLLLADYVAAEYDLRSKAYNVAPAEQKAAALKTAEAALDELIEAYARAVAMTDGDARYKAANDGLRTDLERNYKFRHKGSAEGMQQLIDKYKKTSQ
ncbi:MAG TPA: hypothetical protein VF591_12700 [Pyrinomonadaceae bacterium]|jgi:hypothetical protein